MPTCRPADLRARCRQSLELDAQLVFGDGDGVTFRSSTGSLDVTGHELAHGLTQYTADLAYEGQPGALTESLSDVFGSLAKQHHLGQTTDEADWIIGAAATYPQAAFASARAGLRAPYRIRRKGGRSGERT